MRRDDRDKNNWKTVEKKGRFTVTGEQFFDHNADKGGRGAIDLAIHILGCGYVDARVISGRLWSTKA